MRDATVNAARSRHPRVRLSGSRPRLSEIRTNPAAPDVSWDVTLAALTALGALP